MGQIVDWLTRQQCLRYCAPCNRGMGHMVQAVKQSCRTFGRYWRTVTFKREAALLALAYYGYLIEKYFSMTDPARINALSPAFTTVTWVALPLIASAFGADLWSKLQPANQQKTGV